MGKNGSNEKLKNSILIRVYFRVRAHLDRMCIWKFPIFL